MNGDPFLRYGLMGLGVYLIATGLLGLISPGTFFEEVGPFGVRNDHYTRDGATFQFALGVAALVAVWRPAWRTPILVTLTLQFFLHTLNHLLDIDEADPSWLGPADFAGLALGTVLLGAMLARRRRA